MTFQGCLPLAFLLPSMARCLQLAAVRGYKSATGLYGNTLLQQPQDWLKVAEESVAEWVLHGGAQAYAIPALSQSVQCTGADAKPWSSKFAKRALQQAQCSWWMTFLTL